MVNAERTDWSEKLDDAFLAYITMYKTPTWNYPYQIAFGKTCLLQVELENQAYQAIKKLHLAPDLLSKKRVNQLHELEEFRGHIYENSKLYKEKTKRWNDTNIVSHAFNL